MPDEVTTITVTETTTVATPKAAALDATTPKVFIEIGTGVTVAAKDILQFFENIGKGVENMASPRAMLAFAVLMSAATPVIVDAIAAASVDGLNIPLDITTATLLIELWPDLKAYAETLAIQPAKK